MQITGLLFVLCLTAAIAGCNHATDAKTTTGGDGAAAPKVATTGPEKAAGTTQVSADTKKDDEKAEPKLVTIVIAGGCFWCVEAVFEELEGVTDAVSGYIGGTKETANYEAVSAGSTDHAEAVRITYDPAKISYEKLMAVHFATHDPTTLNRQGADIGKQYRSAIFYADEEEKKQAQAMIDRLTESKAFPRKIVTTLEPLTEFYVAELYHQNYVCDNPFNGYVRNVAMPKVEKVREKFKDDLKKK